MVGVYKKQGSQIKQGSHVQFAIRWDELREVIWQRLALVVANLIPTSYGQAYASLVNMSLLASSNLKHKIDNLVNSALPVLISNTDLEIKKKDNQNYFGVA
ncbi:hypothetical protein B0H34DRAFT_135423 [Crassisporium funariophilum]|nr:hypothetical protein B0H34DRAFT_135423 [Crassisporium funariophilum]